MMKRFRIFLAGKFTVFFFNLDNFNPIIFLNFFFFISVAICFVSLASAKKLDPDFLSKWFVRVDSNSDTFITLDECKNLLPDFDKKFLNKKISSEDLEKYFQLLDDNNDKRIDMNEFKLAVEKQLKKLKSSFPSKLKIS